MSDFRRFPRFHSTLGIVALKYFRIKTPSSWIYQYCFCKEFFYFFSSKEQGIEVCLAGDLFYFGIYFLVGGEIDIGVFIFLYDSEVFDEFDDVEMFIKV